MVFTKRVLTTSTACVLLLQWQATGHNCTPAPPVVALATNGPLTRGTRTCCRPCYRKFLSGGRASA